MKLLNRYILKELTTPFFTTGFILIFVLLSNYVLKHLDRFLGKGLSFDVILKFVFLNSAWIISLAIPMAVLVTTLMTFGKLSSNNEITAIRSSGINNFSILKPCLIFSITIFFLLIPYNLWILPQMNYNVRELSYSISKNRPDIEFQENLLNELSDKIIYLGKRINTNTFSEIVIFDNSYKNSHMTIMAEDGKFISIKDGVLLDLNWGSIHEYTIKNNEYTKTYFDNYKIAIPFEDIGLNDNKLKKQEREMNIGLLIEKKKYFTNKINETNNKIFNINHELDSLKKVNSINNDKLNQDILLHQIAIIEKRQKTNNRMLPMFMKERNKYIVEIHKKFSVPFACIVFVLLGMPLGIMARKGNKGISVLISLAVFIIYWVFLIMGEDLADRTLVNPILGMWAPNIFLGIISYYLYFVADKTNYSFNLNFLRILKGNVKNEKANS